MSEPSPIASSPRDAATRLLLRLGLWRPAKTTADLIRQLTGVSARRRRMAERFYSQFVRRGDLCLDVGANEGKRTEVFLRLGCRVVAVEPQPVCLVHLRKRFGSRADVIVIDKALGSEPGVGELMLSPAHGLSSMSKDWVRTITSSGRFRAFEDHSWKESATVPVGTLDQLIEEYGVPAFTKIDVEGFETEVLRGLSRVLPALSFEFAPEYKRGTNECLSILASLGPYEFNYSVGESMRLALSTWTTSEGIVEALNALTDAAVFGDVYARLPPAEGRSRVSLSTS